MPDISVDETERMKHRQTGKHEKTPIILASVLAKPNQSLYDALIIDVGLEQGIKVGENVFALGNVPIGYISDVYRSSSKVVLFSNPGEKTEVIIPPKNIFMQAVGRGGGNFEMIIPGDFSLEKGNEVVLPGIIPYVVAVVQTTISDPRDSFRKALLISPVNVRELKFVEIKTN